APGSAQAERPLEIAKAAKPVPKLRAQGRGVGEARGPVEPRLEHRAVPCRGSQERAERSRAHRGFGSVEEMEERVLLSRGRVEDLEVPERDLIGRERRPFPERPKLGEL